MKSSFAKNFKNYRRKRKKKMLKKIVPVRGASTSRVVRRWRDRVEVTLSRYRRRPLARVSRACSLAHGRPPHTATIALETRGTFAAAGGGWPRPVSSKIFVEGSRIRSQKLSFYLPFPFPKIIIFLFRSRRYRWHWPCRFWIRLFWFKDDFFFWSRQSNQNCWIFWIFWLEK